MTISVIIFENFAHDCGCVPDAMNATLKTHGLKLVPIERDRGDGRKVHYGEDEQPWDTCMRLGWAGHGAAFSILRYLRRTKEPERDLQAAKIYREWLWKLVTDGNMKAYLIWVKLRKELTEEEKNRLEMQ